MLMKMDDKVLKPEDEEAFQLDLPKHKHRSNKSVVSNAESKKDTENTYPYIELLQRCVSMMKKDDRKFHKLIIPAPIVAFVGSKHTLFLNFDKICLSIQRSNEHLKLFLLNELSTEGSIDKQKRLLMRGRFRPPAIQTLVKDYTKKYVECSQCHKLETRLVKDQTTRLWRLNCDVCSTSYPVNKIVAFMKKTKKEKTK
jgi:translation initiation factor 2 subunit 2